MMPDDDPSGTETTYSIGELTELGGVSRRTVRYYVQRGLLPAPTGAGRGSRYPAEALDTLLEVKRLQERGVSLADIEAHLTGAAQSFDRGKVTAQTVAIPPQPHPEQEIWTRVILDDGVELHLRHRRLSPDQLERLRAAISAVID